MKPLAVSCIVPVYNGARYLGETIESVLSQTEPPAELIVVDDGSIDGSAQVARSFGERVRYILQAHAGVSAARNRGIWASRHDLIAFLDADDLFEPVKLERQMARFVARPELEMSAAHAINFWSPDLPLDQYDRDPQQVAAWPRCLCTWVVRRHLFETIGGFDETMPLSQDVDWNIRVQASGAVIETLPDVLVRRRLHAGNATRTARDRCRQGVLQSVRAHLRRSR
jgi:glycosyltransferase involved in cell wall biosynthesis